MAHIFKEKFSKLESEERKNFLPAKQILNTLNIKKDQTIIDFGCGIGYFSIPALDYVGSDGKVIAIDISEEMITELTTRTKNIPNIEIIKSNSIKGHKADIIFLIMLIHEIDNPTQFLNDCFKALNPNGKIVIIDWQKKETTMGPPLSHRIAKEDLIKMTNKNFIEHNINNSLYFLEFFNSK